MLSELFDTAVDAILTWQNNKTASNKVEAEKALKTLKKLPMDQYTISVVLKHMLNEKRAENARQRRTKTAV